ncbi:MAG TPA: hypothetical protein VGM56_05090, partial [Byssovorax sp.]
DVDAELRATIAAFTAEIVALVHESAREQLARAAPPGPKPARKARGTVAANGAPAVFDELTERVAAFVRGHAAYTAAEIAVDVGVPAADVAKPLVDLLAAGRVRKSGAREQTRYFAT